MAALALSLLTAPNARAGSYVGANLVPGSSPPAYIPYSAGTHYTATGQNAQNQPTFASIADSMYTNSANQQGYGGGSSPTLPNGTHADCSGAISTSWNWVPASGMTMTTDPPPSQVITMQTCTVSVTVQQPGGTGSYATGLGQSGSVSFNPPNNLTGSATDTKYQGMAGGASVSLKSLSAQASVTNSPASASLSYTATVTPITISLTGTMPVSGVQYGLTGQQITATLNGIPTSTGWSVTSYTWTQPSGTCFKNYNNTATSNPLVQLGSTDLTGPASGSTAVASLAFYDSKQENLTVTCKVTVMAPDGSTLNLTVSSPQINMEKPTVSAWGINTGTGPQQGISTGLAVSQNDVMSATEIWGPMTISVPQPFSGGMGCVAQVITADADNATGTTTGGTGVTWVDAVKMPMDSLLPLKHQH